MRAFEFVDRCACPVRSRFFLLLAFFLLCQFLVVPATVRAQSTTPADPATQTAPPAPADAQSPPPDAAPQQTPQDRAKVIRDSQSRINSRRQARVAQTIRETYGSKFEGYFGGGYLRFHPGYAKQRINEADWNVGLTDYIRPRLGLTADFRGYYGSAYIGNNPYGIFLPAISQYSFLFGPQYRLYSKPKYAASVQVLAGFGHGNFDTGTGGLPASYLGLYSDGLAFSLSVAAPLDYNLSPGLAIRLTPLYLLTNYGSSVQNNLGVNAGLVYRWGRH